MTGEVLRGKTKKLNPKKSFSLLIATTPLLTNQWDFLI